MWQFFLHKYNLWYLWQIWALESRHTFDFEPPPINCTVCDLNSGVANKLQYIAATWQKYRLQNRKMYYRESAMTMRENDIMWGIAEHYCGFSHEIWKENTRTGRTGVCFANDKGSRMIYQSKVQMAHPIGSSTNCLTEMLIIRKCWQKKYDAYCFGIANKSCRYYQITKIIFSGSRWDRTGRAGVLLLDVFDLEHPKRIQGSLLRGRPGRNIQKHPNTPQNPMCYQKFVL